MIRRTYTGCSYYMLCAAQCLYRNSKVRDALSSRCVPFCDDVALWRVLCILSHIHGVISLQHFILIHLEVCFLLFFCSLFCRSHALIKHSFSLVYHRLNPLSKF